MLNPQFLLIAMLPMLLGALILLEWRRRTQRARSQEGGTSKDVIHLECSVCHHKLVFNVLELVPLSPAESALTVRVRPNVVGRKLSEYVCPHCEAAHCFAVDVRPPQWLGANFYQPQRVSSHCYECRRQLRIPTWQRGRYDGRLQEAAELLPDHGLVCAFCHAVCCVACCRRHTMNRIADGSLMCPRCSRYPIETVFHP